MKKVFLMLLCAVSVVLVSCHDRGPQGSTYSVLNEVDFNVMTTLTSQFALDSTTMEGVINNLGFTTRTPGGAELYYYFRNAEEAKDMNHYPFITMRLSSKGNVDCMHYTTYTSNNVVASKSQIVSQMTDTVVVMTKNYLFEHGRCDGGGWITSYTDFLPMMASATSLDVEWSQILWNEEPSMENYVSISVNYTAEANLTTTTYSCTPADLK